jgi:hypothetical protein
MVQFVTLLLLQPMTPLDKNTLDCVVGVYHPLATSLNAATQLSGATSLVVEQELPQRILNNSPIYCERVMRLCTVCRDAGS